MTKKHFSFINSLRYFTLFLAFALILQTPCLSVHAEGQADTQTADIIFLHDTHSHLNSFLTVQDGQSTEVGGFASIKTLINEAKEKNPDTLVLDAGDFSMNSGSDHL